MTSGFVQRRDCCLALILDRRERFVEHAISHKAIVVLMQS